MESELEAKAWELFKEWSKDAAGMPTIKDSLRIAKDWIACRDSLRPAPATPEERREAMVFGNAGDQIDWPQHRINGWAPGNYSCTCSGCGRGYWGDKRSVECWPCASRAPKPLAPTEPADLPLPYQAETIARGEMAERLRVAEAEVERLRAGIRKILAGCIPSGTFARNALEALLEGAQPCT